MMRLLPLLTSVAAVVALTLGSAQAAQAADIDGAITGVEIMETSPAQNSLVTTAIDWEVPDGTKAGDTFSLTLSSHLDDLPLGFGLDDPKTGARVANATLSLTTPAVITFTMTSYASTHLDTKGTAYVRSGFDNRSTPSGVPTDFTSTTGGGVAFTTTVTPTGSIGDRSSAIKYGNFTRGDQGRVNPAGFLGYHIATPVGPFASATVSDSPVDQPWTFDCSSLEYFRVVTDADYRYLSQTRTTPTSATCTPTSLVVEWDAQPALTYGEIYVTVSVPAATGVSSAPQTFANTARVATRVGTTEATFLAPAENIQSSSGGQGAGTPVARQAPPVASPSPTSTPTPTGAPAGTPAGPAIVPAAATTDTELASTGSDAALPLGAAGALLLLGAGFVVAGRRRSSRHSA